MLPSLVALPCILKERFAMRFADPGKRKKIGIALDTDFKIHLQRIIDGEIKRRKRQ